MELRYFIHCNCALTSHRYVLKEIRTIDRRKVSSVTKFHSLIPGEQPTFNTGFLPLDSFALFQLPKQMNLNYSQDCISIQDSLKLINGFIEIGEYQNPKDMKPVFKKAVRLEFN